MASPESSPPRQMSLIPYPHDSRQVVLRRPNAVVVYDAQSRQLSARSVPEPNEAVDEVTECPLCHRPYDSPRQQDDTENSEDHLRRPFVGPDYFGLLAASRQATPNPSSPSTPTRRSFFHALRSGRSRDVSGASVSVPDSPTAASSSGDGSISPSAFSEGYFAQFFTEKQVLGKGGHGVVLLVEHIMDRVSLGHFACKRITVGNNHRWLKKVLIEVQLLKTVPHKNLVAYHWAWLEHYKPTAYGPSTPCLWILQEYCNGGDLHSYVLGPKQDTNAPETLKSRFRRRSRNSPERPATPLRGPSKLTFDEIFSFFRDITSGLHHLHMNGYVHRDLKPSNCLLQLSSDGGRPRVLISDFGEAQAAGSKRDASATGATGTISYCAPEVLVRNGVDDTFGDFTPSSDIFSLGMIVYFLCFGRLPYTHASAVTDSDEAEDLDALRAEITAWQGFNPDESAARTVRPDLPEKLYRFLRRLLSVRPSERPSTGEILEGIRGGTALSDASENIDSTGGRPSSQGRRRSGVVNRLGLSSMGAESRCELSPVKMRRVSSGNGSGSGKQAHAKPKAEVARIMPPRDESPPPSSRGPPLMLPPPPPPLLATIVPQAARLAIFTLQLASLTLPCMPYAANAWLLFPLLALATLQLSTALDVRQMTVALATHVLLVGWAVWSGRLCAR